MFKTFKVSTFCGRKSQRGKDLLGVSSRLQSLVEVLWSSCSYIRVEVMVKQIEIWKMAIMGTLYKCFCSSIVATLCGGLPPKTSISCTGVGNLRPSRYGWTMVYIILVHWPICLGVQQHLKSLTGSSPWFSMTKHTAWHHQTAISPAPTNDSQWNRAG